jgi:hypothetical protein
MSASQRYRTVNVPELNVLNLKKDNNFNASVTSNIESSKRKEFIEYFTKTTKKRSELDKPFHKKWSDLLQELTGFSQPLREKIYVVTEKDKDYSEYLKKEDHRKKYIKKKLTPYSSKKLHKYLLDKNPGFSKILNRVKDLDFQKLKEIFSHKFDDEEDEIKWSYYLDWRVEKKI